MPKTKVEMLRWLIEGTPVREGYSKEELMSEVDELIKAVREENNIIVKELEQKISELYNRLYPNTGPINSCDKIDKDIF